MRFEQSIDIDAQQQRVWDFLSDAQVAEIPMVAQGQIVDEAPEGGFYQAPTLLRDVPVTHRLAQEEVFGPVLGLITAKDLATATGLQNATGYGLTGGLHSLDEKEIAWWLDHVEVGNAYVNRQITGAIVQRQSFGGWKGSGSSGKSGLGPYYVQQFLREQSQTVISDEEPPTL